MNSVGKTLLQLRTYKTVRVAQGLSHLRNNHERDRTIAQNKINEQRENKKKELQLAKEEEKKRVAAIPPLVTYNLSCPGCGAKYQHQNSERAGYLEYSRMMNWNASSPIPCDRCEKVSESEHHRMYSISEGRFSKLLQKISQKRALGIVVCDIVGFPSTLPPDLPNIYPVNSPVILCLNKCDVLATTGGKMNIIMEYYLPIIEKWEKQNNFKFNEIVLASGRTGIGLPELALHIQQYIYGDKYCNDLDFCYLLGLTNAGKSTLFNKLSPLMNNKMKCIGNVTESPHPGTTVTNITSVIKPPPKITRNQKHAVSQLLDRKVNKLEKLVFTTDLPPDISDNSQSTWFKDRIDQQLRGNSEEKILIDTPGVLANDSIPEAVFACQHKILNRFVELSPGSCLSFGWYKIYYVRGNVSLKLGVNLPTVIEHEIISDVSDSTIGLTDSGVKLCNKLFLMSRHSNDRARVSGDICLGNLGWISVHIPPGDDVTVLVFAPRLGDIHYRTPGFHLNVPKFDNVRAKRDSFRNIHNKVQYDEDMFDDV